MPEESNLDCNGLELARANWLLIIDNDMVKVIVLVLVLDSPLMLFEVSEVAAKWNPLQYVITRRHAIPNAWRLLIECIDDGLPRIPIASSSCVSFPLMFF